MPELRPHFPSLKIFHHPQAPPACITAPRGINNRIMEIKFIKEKLSALASANTTCIVYFPETGALYTGNPGGIIGRRGKNVTRFREEWHIRITQVREITDLVGNRYKTATTYPRFSKGWGQNWEVSINESLAKKLKAAILIGCEVTEEP